MNGVIRSVSAMPTPHLLRRVRRAFTAALLAAIELRHAVGALGHLVHDENGCPGRGQRFTATAVLLRSGNKVAVVRSELHSEDGTLVAVGTGTYLTG